MFFSVPFAELCTFHVVCVSPKWFLWFAVFPFTDDVVVLCAAALPSSGWIVAPIWTRRTPKRARIKMVSGFIPVHQRSHATNAKPMHAAFSRKLCLSLGPVTDCAFFAIGTISERKPPAKQVNVTLNAKPTFNCQHVLSVPLVAAHFMIHALFAVAH